MRRHVDEWGGRLGEVVEASTTTLRAVAVAPFEGPSFGSFVRAGSESLTTFGVVSHVWHTSIDPARRAIPLGRTWEELRREQPHVLDLLSTEFEAVCVGFEEGGEVFGYLPPSPPRVHEFVYACSSEEVVRLTEDLTFVRTLASRGGAVAELVAAAIRAAVAVRADAESFRLRAGREVADLFRQDYELAASIIRRIQPVRVRVPR